MSVLKVKNGNTWIEIPAGGAGVPSGGTSGQLLKRVTQQIILQSGIH